MRFVPFITTAKPMPQGSDKLEQDVIDQLTCWVKNGAVQ